MTIIERRPANLQTLRDHLTHGLPQPLPFLHGKGTGRSARMDLCLPQDLVSVDVTQPGDCPLIEQELLDRYPASGESGVQVLWT